MKMTAEKREQLKARHAAVKAATQIKDTWRKVLSAEIAIGAEKIARMNAEILAAVR